jgi:hypothetical protein
LQTLGCDYSLYTSGIIAQGKEDRRAIAPDVSLNKKHPVLPHTSSPLRFFCGAEIIKYHESGFYPQKTIIIFNAFTPKQDSYTGLCYNITIYDCLGYSPSYSRSRNKTEETCLIIKPGYNKYTHRRTSNVINTCASGKI